MKHRQLLIFFLWKDSPPRVKHSSLIASYDKGGVRAPDIVSHYKALRLAWLAHISNSKLWCSIAITFFDKYGGLDFFQHCNYNGNSLYLLPTFYKNMMLFSPQPGALFRQGLAQKR